MPEEKILKITETEKSGLTKKFFKSFVDVKRWSSYDEVSANTKTTINLYRRFFSRSTEPIHQETYEQSVARLNLNETQLANRKRAFLYSALIYFAFALVFFIYFIYLLVHMHLYAACLEFILLGLVSIVAYREHFWYMQMQKKKLGCNFYDWVAFILRRAK
ncbi:intracellular multiplication protein IcmV [Gammaproteobacteria bacterium]